MPSKKSSGWSISELKSNNLELIRLGLINQGGGCCRGRCRCCLRRHRRSPKVSIMSSLVKIKSQGGEVVKFRVLAEVFEVEEAGGRRDQVRHWFHGPNLRRDHDRI